MRPDSRRPAPYSPGKPAVSSTNKNQIGSGNDERAVFDTYETHTRSLNPSAKGSRPPRFCAAAHGQATNEDHARASAIKRAPIPGQPTGRTTQPGDHAFPRSEARKQPQPQPQPKHTPEHAAIQPTRKPGYRRLPYPTTMLKSYHLRRHQQRCALALPFTASGRTSTPTPMGQCTLRVSLPADMRKPCPLSATLRVPTPKPSPTKWRSLGGDVTENCQPDERLPPTGLERTPTLPSHLQIHRHVPPVCNGISGCTSSRRRGGGSAP
jgi:hypothetical protein